MLTDANFPCADDACSIELGLRASRDGDDDMAEQQISSSARTRRDITPEELLALPAVVDLTTAARVLGIGRTCAYELVRTGAWPTPVLRVGRLIRIPTAPLLDLLSVERAPRRAG